MSKPGKSQKISNTVRKPRIGLFDIEATNLSASFGYLLSVSWKFLGESKIHNHNISQCSTWGPTDRHDRSNDKELVEKAINGLNECDMIVSWNGKRYDVPFINTRAVKHNISPLAPIPHLDGLEIAWKKMRMHSNRLISVEEFLGYQEKTPLRGDQWNRAAAGHFKNGLDYVINHNNKDIISLEKVYGRIRQLWDQHPNVGLTEEVARVLRGDLDNIAIEQIDSAKALCPICGSKGLQSRGRSITRTGYRRRFQCLKCGGWSASGHKKLVAVS